MQTNHKILNEEITNKVESYLIKALFTRSHRSCVGVYMRITNTIKL